MTTSFFKLKNSVFSLFVMTCPPTPHRGHIEEFWIGISKAQNVKNYRFEAPKPPKMVLTSPKWPRNIQVTILNPYGNFVFEAQNCVFSLFEMTCPPTHYKDHFEEFWIGLPEVQIVKNFRFEALKSPKNLLTSPKWFRNILITILNQFVNFIFEAKK